MWYDNPWIEQSRDRADVNVFVRGVEVPATLPVAPTEDGELNLKNSYSAPVMGQGTTAHATASAQTLKSQRLVYRLHLNVITGSLETV